MALYLALLYWMGTLKWCVYSFQLPLTSGGIREGLLVHCLLDDGEELWGEVAPLPGRSKETLAEAKTQLLQLLQGEIPPNAFLLPSVQFCMESLFSPVTFASAPLYALLSANDSRTLFEQADAAEKQGHTVVKIKLSPFSTAIGKEILHQLKDRFRLRIDCNSAFSFEQALDLFSPFDPAIFDYIEDPTYEQGRLSSFPYPFALDESVESYAFFTRDTHPSLYGFILKPTVLGGEKGCAPLIAHAHRHHLKVVFSPTFETGIGLLQILKLAQKCELVSEPIGLGTHRYLKEDVLQTSYPFNASHLTWNRAKLHIHKHKINEIAHGNTPLPHLHACHPVP